MRATPTADELGGAQAPEVDVPSPRGVGRAGSSIDLLWISVFLAVIAWVFLSSAVSGGAPGPTAGLLAGSLLALVGARLLTTAGRSLVPVAVVAVSIGMAVAAGSELTSGEPLSGPFGYANASGAFFAQAALAALVLAAIVRRPVARGIAAGTAAGLASVVLFTGSVAATVLVLALPAAGLALLVMRSARAAILFCGAAFAAMLAVTVLLGATYDADARSGLLDRAADASLTERRVALWHEALVMMADRPVTGVGPGRFAAESATALADADARWAHNEFLEQGAELGVAGFTLLALVFGLGFVRLWVSDRLDAVTVLAAVALAALGIQSSMDYVMHAPVIPVATAALVGMGTAPRRAE